MMAMEKLVQWLKTFPLWNDQKIYMDGLAAAPENTGLYPGGLEEISRCEDVLGNVTVRCRLHFILYRRTFGQQDNLENSAWLLQFQNWVQEQSAAGLAPVFGDDAKKEHIRAEHGKLHPADQTGTGKYAVDITAEFEKHY